MTPGGVAGGAGEEDAQLRLLIMERTSLFCVVCFFFKGESWIIFCFNQVVILPNPPPPLTPDKGRGGRAEEADEEDAQLIGDRDEGRTKGGGADQWRLATWRWLSR